MLFSFLLVPQDQWHYTAVTKPLIPLDGPISIISTQTVMYSSILGSQLYLTLLTAVI